MSADNIDPLLKRFRASEAQEKEVVDDSAGYRALLRQTSEPAARKQPETKSRAAKPQTPVPADSTS